MKINSTVGLYVYISEVVLSHDKLYISIKLKVSIKWTHLNIMTTLVLAKDSGSLQVEPKL